MRPEVPLCERLLALLDHLGVASAHMATQMPADLAGFAARHAPRLAGVTLVVPVRLDPAPFAAVASRLQIITGDSGVSRQPSLRAAERLAGATVHTLRDYATTGWSDVAEERTAEVVAAMSAHLASASGTPASPVPPGIPRSGDHAGITFRIDGNGPALVLLPFFLAASQWDAAVPALADRFTVIRVGGPHTGGVSILEERAAQTSYQAMFRTLVDLLDPPGHARVLDVGCGSGALDRALARRAGFTGRIDAIDVNGYLRREAGALAEAAGLAGVIQFGHGSAEAIPFPDETFDCAFSVTVLEECDADRAIREIVRVLKPGGRAGLVVRAIDMPQWWSVDVPADIWAKASEPPQSVGAAGVADKSLYRRMLDAGLVGLVPFPSLVTLDRPGNTVWRYREDALAALLTPPQEREWLAARHAAEQAGTLFQAHAMHCAVARKPG